jgi:Spo0E like sporulation regulatory protein.
MINERIELLREKLNEMVERDNSDGEEVLKVSQELDVLIMEFMKEKYKEMSSAL